MPYSACVIAGGKVVTYRKTNRSKIIRNAIATTGMNEYWMNAMNHPQNSQSSWGTMKNGTNSGPTSAYHRWYKWLSRETPQETAEFALGAALGASRVARRSSDAISEVIEEITEPIRPKRARKTAGEGAKTTKTARGAKPGKGAKK